ncbi:cobaltochelatase subunit CobN [Methanolapillus ohkumae]|uniref:CobN/magnesium chelatase domain-containing protein n=1 Tax=Methanolapillus ohkumae TaxID=3028298 RepID=A0AA96VE32_9EURY|nr:hypothetical protein MsAm2_03680 [Methanosarcinaceae archaeon Am2]
MKKLNTLFVLLLLLMSMIPMTGFAGAEDNGVASAYAVIAMAKSTTKNDPNFQFNNIPAGTYSIVAHNLMSVNPYMAIAEVTVTNDNVSVGELVMLKANDGTNIENKFVYDNVYSLIRATDADSLPATSGSYNISGIISRTSSGSRNDNATLYLIQGPIITNVVYDLVQSKLIIKAYGAESVEVSYVDVAGKTKTKTPIKSTGIYTLDLTSDDIVSGQSDVVVTAKFGSDAVSQKIIFENGGYQVVAMAKSTTKNDPNYIFGNIPAGKYVIVATNFMGVNPYTVIEEVIVTDSDVAVNEIVMKKANDPIDLNLAENKLVYDTIYVPFLKSLQSEDIPVLSGSYKISGIVSRSNPGSKNDNATLYLLKGPVITSASYDTSKSQVKVKAYGSDFVSVSFMDANNAKTTIENFNPSNNEYTINIPASDLKIGRTDITITAKTEMNTDTKKVVAIQGDPALLGAPRKVVIITGHSYAGIINDLKSKYDANGSNVELILIETKKVNAETAVGYRKQIKDADVITIHMITTSTTWSLLNDSIKTTCTNGAFLYDDNRTARSPTTDYKIKSVYGVSDTPANLAAYDTKIGTYWSNAPFEPSNLESMVNMVLQDFYGRYDLDSKEPVTLPDKMIYHPHMDNLFISNYDDYITWYQSKEKKWDGEDMAYKYDSNKPTVGIVFYKAYYPDKIEPINKMIEEFEKADVNVIATFSENGLMLDGNEMGGKYFRKGELDAIMMFRYMGSAYFNATELNVPVFNVMAVDMTKEEWEKSSNPLGTTVSNRLVNQELNGFIDPIVVMWTDETNSTKPLNDQIIWLKDRVLGQITLQEKANADKNVAVIYYNHGGGKGNIGASYLNVPESIISLLNGMESAGYNINSSKAPDAETLVTSMTTQGINIGNWAPGELKKMIGDFDVSGGEDIYDTGKAVLISKELYLEWFHDVFLGDWFEASIAPLSDDEKTQRIAAQEALYQSKLKEVEKLWGTAPGNIMVYEGYLVIPYINVSDESGTGDGRVILTPQPSRAAETSIEALYHNTTIPPTHQYIAFYLWLQHEHNLQTNPQELGFDADALIHLGRHGTQEWLPGKETGLSRYDWPALMVGGIPVIYPYIVDGIGEGLNAKRRGDAVIVDHMTPAVVYAGIDSSTDYGKLNENIFQYQSSEGTIKAGYKQSVIDGLVKLGLDKQFGTTKSKMEKMSDAEFNHVLDQAEEVLEEIRMTYIPYGLHVLGKPLEGEALNGMVYSMLGSAYINRVKEAKGTENTAYSMIQAVVSGVGPSETVSSSLPQATSDQKTELVKDLTNASIYAGNLKISNEIPQILRALNGEFIQPKAGGDPVAKPQVLPTGGNFQSIDPKTIPSPQAWDIAVKLTDQFLADYYEKNNNKWPNTMAFILWAGETSRQSGVLEAQIMYLMGIQPTWSGVNIEPLDENSNKNVIPASELKVTLNNGTMVTRPRIDVVVEISGVYRDTFPDKILMLDKAVRIAYNQTDGVNYVRENTDKIYNNGKNGFSKDEAMSRIFGPAADSYGAGMADLVGSTNAWDSADQLAKHYISRMGFIYNSVGSWGSINNEKLYEKRLSTVDVTIHSRSSSIYGVTDIDDFYQYLGGLNAAVRYSRPDGKEPASYVMDLRKPGNEKMTDLETYISNELAARALNPKWQEGMRENGYAGSREMAKMIENLWGWKALQPDLISDQMWNQVYEALLTGENKEWLKTDPANAYSYQSMIARMIDAATKDNGKYWNADQKVLNDLVNQYVDSVIDHGVACCHHTCGNPFFDSFIQGQMSVAGVSEEKQKQFLDTLMTATEREIKPLESGKKDSGGAGGYGMAIVSGGESAEQKPVENPADSGAGYGTDLGAKSGTVDGYEMIPTTINSATAALRDFLGNPTFSTSSFVAIAIVILLVGAVFFGFRRKGA